MNCLPRITICICTYQRPKLLQRLLVELGRQETQGRFTFSVVVADNDARESGRRVVEEWATTVSFGVVYVVEPRRSISHARNKCLEPARGELIAFIDDDEFPTREWLLKAYLALTEYNVAGVLGPVRSEYDPATPAWVKKCGCWERPEHATGFFMSWAECRTGNVLIRKCVLEELDPVFEPRMGPSGSDVDLFRRLMQHGHRFIWCNEAIVYEFVPLGRCKRVFLLRRALLRGSMSWRRERSIPGIVKALVAVPLYGVLLPFLSLLGHHLFMMYLVKLCDHLGRLLAVFGLDPVRSRDMQ